MRPDNVLLKEFCANPDGDGFAVLMRRHGSVVRAAAKSVLGDTIALDDVVQATFIILARKAAHLQKDRSLASWLYHVSTCLARNERRNEKRRKSREESTVMESGSRVEIPEALNTQWTLLHESIDALPEKFRAPIVLYYMEGYSYREGAAQLGLTEKTFSSRLSRARKRLNSRMSKHGATLSIAALFTAFNESMAADIPSALISTTTSAARAIVAGKTVASGLVSAKATAMAKTGMDLLFWTKVKTAAVAVFAMVAATVLTMTAIDQPTEKSQMPAVILNNAGKEGMARIRITPRLHEAVHVLRMLPHQKLRAYIMNEKCPIIGESRIELLVPPKLRCKEVDAASLMEAIAEYNSMQIHWQPAQNCCILYRGISDRKLARLKRDLAHTDIAVRKQAVWRAGWYSDIRVVPLLLSAAREKALESYLRASLRRLNWAAVIALDKRGWLFANAELSNSDPMVRTEAIYAFCSKGGERTVDYLKEAIVDRDHYVRMAARKALSEISSSDTVSSLGKELRKHDEYYVFLLKALGEIGGKEAFSLLEREFREKNTKMEQYRRRVFDAICETDDRRVYSIIQEALAEENLRPHAAYNLGNLGKGGDSRALPLLLKILSEGIRAEEDRSINTPDRHMRLNSTNGSAIGALGTIGHESAIPLIERWLMSSNRVGDGVGMMALFRIGGKRSFEVIRKGFERTQLRPHAAIALGMTGKEEAIPLLEKALKDTSARVRSCAVNALGMIGGKRASSLIAEAMKDEAPEVRQNAIVNLITGADKGSPITLKKMLSSENAFLRHTAIRYGVKVAYTIDIEELVALLEKALKDRNSSVSYSAVFGLGRIGGDKAASLLIETLASSDTRLRMCAVKSLASSTFESQRGRIIRALRSRMEIETSSRVRTEISDGLAKLWVEPKDTF